MTRLIRPVEPCDAPAIAALLHDQIAHHWAHFATRAPTPEQVAHQIAWSAPYPWIVAEDDGVFVGYAQASPWKSREAYDWCAEIGSYIAADRRGQGHGKALTAALLERLRDEGFRRVIAGIALPNPASVALVEAFGFDDVGVFPGVGYKREGWRDVGYWILALDGDASPGRSPRARARRPLPIAQVDAFTSRCFAGNPAAVVRLDRWLPDETLAAIGAENNLSETAFLVPREGGVELRWFTPTVEVDLCGHATLAAGFVWLREEGGDEVTFHTRRSGALIVRRSEHGLALEMPSVPPLDAPLPADVIAALGATPVETFQIRSLHHADYGLAVFESRDVIAALDPDTRRLGALKTNVICAAPGEGEVDFVSRFFAPGSGVDEDPVTGSAHCTLTPYWSARLGKKIMRAQQISARGGDLRCVLHGDRVTLHGGCALYLEGTLWIDAP